MLVLTRKGNQSIMIGDDIEVSVLAVMGEKVRIGVQAPRSVPVFRKEVYVEIQAENLAAGASDPSGAPLDAPAGGAQEPSGGTGHDAQAAVNRGSEPAS